MSTYERNKGKLIPTHMDTEHFTEEDFDNLQDNGLVVINGEVYEVRWEVEREIESALEFADVNQNVNGVIDFHTLHYNGSAHWTEVIEDSLKYY